MILRRVCLMLSFVILSLNGLSAQDKSDTEAVLMVVNQLFDGMREADSAKVRACFHQGARLQTILQNPETKLTRLHSESGLESFLQQIAAPHEEIYDEQLQNPEVRIDGALATVWAPYRFYIGKTFSHCGVNAFQLVLLEGKWRITQIIDTRRREPCD